MRCGAVRCSAAALSCRSVSSQASNSSGFLSLIPLSQLTSGEMADLDGSDASPPESQGEFLPTKLKKKKKKKFSLLKLDARMKRCLNPRLLSKRHLCSELLVLSVFAR